MAAEMKASIHRFRLRQASPARNPSGDHQRRRSASPGERVPQDGEETPSITAAASGVGSASSSATGAGGASASFGRSGGSGRHAIPACDRCRSFKKKCSRTFPACTLCSNAGQKCSYSSPASTAEGQAVQLAARVQWLSEFINGNWLGPNPGIENIETGTDLRSALSPLAAPSAACSSPTSVRFTRPPHKQQGMDTAPATPHSEIPISTGVRSSLDLLGGTSSQTVPLLDQQSVDMPIEDGSVPSPLDPGSAGPAASHASYQGSVGTNEGGARRFAANQMLPLDAAARRFVDAYFRNVNRAYPFVDQRKALSYLETLGEFANRRRDAHSTLLYLVMAIGCTTLERAGQIARDTSRRFDVFYPDIIQECLSRDSIESIQILVLLALYSLFDPAGTSSYSIVGFAARQAVLWGLSRRPAAGGDEEDPPSAATSNGGSEWELRHRLYWSIFVLDRMMAVSHGLPFALTDRNADVPLPGLTIEEFASAERAAHARNLQTSRHVIQLRQLEDRILREVHFRPRAEVAQIAAPDRRAVLAAIRAEIEDWYSSGCLMSPLEQQDNVPIHCSITWLSARYYHGLLLLYWPNYYNSAAAAVSRSELVGFVRRQLQSTSVLFQQRQLPLNRVTLCRLLPVCLVLFHDYVASCDEFANGHDAVTRQAVPYQARDEVAVLISILEAFPEGWTVAHQAAQVARQFAGVVSGGVRPSFPAQSVVYPLGSAVGTAADTSQQIPKSDPQESARLCIADMRSLLRKLLGKATCYQYVEFAVEESEVPKVNSSTSLDLNFSHQQMTLSSSVQDQNLPQSELWGQWDLDFL